MIKRNIKKITSVILTMTMMLSLAACNKTPTPEKYDEQFISYTSNFSVELFKECVYKDAENGKNILISPESVMCALSMTTNGADGQTLENMKNVLMGGNDISEHNASMSKYNNSLLNSRNVEFNMGNSIWIKDSEDIQVKDEFTDICQEHYNADTFLVPFDDTTLTDINSWVDDKTEGKISQLVNEIKEDEVMYLINALAFEGVWEKSYKDHEINENGEFTNYCGEKQKVNMLSSKEEIYLSDENAVGFVKAYKGGDFAFMAILPNEEIGVENYIENMSGDALIKMYKNRENKDVVAKIPEFSCEYDIELSGCLSNMGMGDAFTEVADFSNMATTKTGCLFIKKVLHKTYIEIDRTGTKAAASTAVVMTTKGVSEDMEYVILDRPFIYAIIDTETGLPVFLGVLNTVK